MTKPYAHWDPSTNPALHVRTIGGPLVIDVENNINRALLDKLVGHACAQPMLDDAAVGYLEALQYVEGTAPETGVRIQQFPEMPDGLAFYGTDATNGEPRPFDDCDAIGAPWSLQTPYVTLGYRAVLRGYAATIAEGALAADVQVTWADGIGTRSAAAARGGYAGALLRVMGAEPTVSPTMHYAYPVAHGKRPTTDTNWAYHPGKLTPGGVTAGSITVANGIAGGQLRLITYGGPPTWSVLLQYWTGTAWATLYSTTDDFRSEQTVGYEDYIGVVAELIAGGALVQSSPPTTDPDVSVWFSRVELAQFEPWVLDRSAWSYREWDRHWAWLTSVYTPYFLPRRRPAMDLQHVPMGVPGAPTQLRASDPDLGVCVEFAPETWLFTVPPWDMTGMLYTVADQVHAAVCDEGWYGYQAPFAMLGRFRFQRMATWTLDRVIMAAGEPWSAIPHVNNGMGIHWEPTGAGAGAGKLVLRAYDATAAQWVDVEHPFHAADYDDQPVDVAFAWSGARGAAIGHDDYELRLVIDGVTVASTVNADIRLLQSKRLLFGTYKGVLPVVTQQSFEGMFREGMAFADAVTDADLRAAFAATSDLDNPSFEIAAPSGRPGEAAGWTWHSVQQVGGWAAFNGYRADLEQWWTAQEEFGAGFRFPYAWSYADASERLAATGFVAADVGKAAWQRDDDSYWLLVDYDPILWSEIVIPSNDEWASVLVPIAGALFNFGTTLRSAQETFVPWTFAGAVAPPWLEAYTLSSPADDEVGFDGWYDALYGTTAYPLVTEEFGEAWKTDPFSTVGDALWISGACSGGALRGGALTFPVTIRPEQARLIIYADYQQAYILELIAGTYADGATLAAMLQAAWEAADGGPTGLSFSTWADGAATGLTFGWNGTPTTIMAIFGVLQDERYRDARSVLCLEGRSPTGARARVRMPANLVVTQPASVGQDDTYLLDVWTMILFRVATDPSIAGMFVIEYNWVTALYDDASTLLERFTLVGWYGPGATWQASYGPGDLYAAVFDGISVTEDFTPANWPDEEYPF